MLNVEVPDPFSESVIVLVKPVSVLPAASRATTTGSVLKSSAVPEVTASGAGCVVKTSRVAVTPTCAAVALPTAALLPDMLDPADDVTSVSPSMENEKEASSVRLVLVL